MRGTCTPRQARSDDLASLRCPPAPGLGHRQASPVPCHGAAVVPACTWSAEQRLRAQPPAVPSPASQQLQRPVSQQASFLKPGSFFFARLFLLEGRFTHRRRERKIAHLLVQSPKAWGARLGQAAAQSSTCPPVCGRDPRGRPPPLPRCSSRCWARSTGQWGPEPGTPQRCSMSNGSSTHCTAMLPSQLAKTH